MGIVGGSGAAPPNMRANMGPYGGGGMGPFRPNAPSAGPYGGGSAKGEGGHPPDPRKAMAHALHSAGPGGGGNGGGNGGGYPDPRTGWAPPTQRRIDAWREGR
jgi:hypothetical protein